MVVYPLIQLWWRFGDEKELNDRFQREEEENPRFQGKDGHTLGAADIEQASGKGTEAARRLASNE